MRQMDQELQGVLWTFALTNKLKNNNSWMQHTKLVISRIFLAPAPCLGNA